ncbi:2Fe-2S iron-sulfur cluster binding domain-containing protein [Paenibacillus zeisoli]|uniref:2Fe-2S iron-sulfur cluster binding domain-containing protein n=1 Tax=Paenibacillus zeisoli TaxID=2496267 RepID=A0A3S1BAX8_9BACL|nr:2Fe-2S iron-sulfur cluster-binding protein [Paenibacillus zeisoli]RUT36094.1 2Fe-2S iron-sulfur cluster binding domain-containing protein [Paenibacillus zeisoli]
MDCEIKFEPTGKIVKVRRGTSVLSAARQGRIHIATRCGGNAGCLMCKVNVPDQQGQSGLSTPTDAERRKLGSMMDQGTRLACQAKVTGPAVVVLPEDPLKAAIRRQLEKQQAEDDLW